MDNDMGTRKARDRYQHIRLRARDVVAFPRPAQLYTNFFKTRESEDAVLQIQIGPQRTHLNSLILQRLLRVMDVLEADTVELSLVYVRDAVIFAPLRRTNRTL